MPGEGRASQPTAPPTAHGDSENHVPYWMMVPFAFLLGAIAVLPLVPATSHWWHSNLHRFYVAGGLAAVTLAYYLFLHASVLDAHWPAPHAAAPSASGLNFVLTGEILASAILGEYLPFIVLLWSLYTISGGIRIEGDLPAHPLDQHGVPGGRRRAGQPHRHDGRRDAPDPPAVGNQSRAKTRATHRRFLHLHRLQLRRAAAALGRSAALPRLFDGRPLFVDHSALEGVAGGQRGPARDLLCLGPVLVLSARAARRRGSG